MNNMNTNNQSDNFVKNTYAAEADHADVLELFAEELPEQHDLLGTSCVGTYGTALSCVGGSTFSSFSSYGCA